VATSSNDRTIRFWNPDANYSSVGFQIDTALTQMCLRWNDHYKLLFSSDVGNTIRAWDFQTYEDHKFQEQYEPSRSITCICSTTLITQHHTAQ
jgi:WD40 repeat protein